METFFIVILSIFMFTNPKPNVNWQEKKSKIESIKKKKKRRAAEIKSSVETMKTLLKRNKFNEKKLNKYAKAFHRYGMKHGVDINLILAVGFVESGYRNIHNEHGYEGTGVLQSLFRESHIRKFVRKTYHPKTRNYIKWAMKNPTKAINVSIWELSHFKKEYKRYIRFRCKFNWRWKKMLTPMSVDGKVRKDFKYLPFYNWGGNQCHTKKGSFPRHYPIKVMRTYRKIIKIVRERTKDAK